MPASLKFIIYENRTDVNGQAPIYLRILCDNKKRYYNTGERIRPHYLRDKPQYNYWIKRSHDHNNLIDEKLKNIFDKAQRLASDLRGAKRESSEAIYKRLVGASKENFFTIAKEELKHLEKQDQYYLKKQTNATLNKLEEYHGSRELKFTKIDSGFIDGFQDWMQIKKGNKGSTIRKNMSDFRRILERAADHNLIFNDPFEDVKSVSTGSPEPKLKLTYEQIKKIENVSLPEGSTAYHVRNSFLLAFYLNGVRFGDMLKMTWDRIQDGRISYRMSKTGSVVYFKIANPAQRILDLYEDDSKGAKDVILPFLNHLSESNLNNKTKVEKAVSSSLATVNETIKEVGKKAGIDEETADRITTHVARHSFAQYLANKDISIYEISRQLRHTSVSTTENYLDRLGLQAKDQTIETTFE